MVEAPIQILKWLHFQVNPPKVERIDYCRNPHPLYVTEEHCPPKHAPEIPRRDF